VASDRVTIPLSLGGSGIKTAGELQRAYYAVPNGYAIVTRVEQIRKDGKSEPPPYRFSDEIPPPRDLQGYLAGLFTSRPGYYRIIVFIATNVAFNDTAQPLSEYEAMV
jgi:hypothetical protein